ncbi:MAG TPA: GreA/GreB family elongation factor [Patescibacteria group bacterium]
MITKIGKEKLEKELEELKKELRRTVEERAKAAAEGDLRENSAYLFYGERAEVLRSQIAQVEADLKAAKIQSVPSQVETVSFGHSVRIRFENDNRELLITLVGKNDARIKPDWISLESPLGIALLGKKKSDKVLVNDQPVIILEITIADLG